MIHRKPFSFGVITTIIVTLTMAASAGSSDQQEVPFFEGLGDCHRKVTTTSPEAQRFFDQGLAFLYAFNHDEAVRSFKAATERDPACAMAWWGIATANGPHINNPMVDPEHAHVAWDAVQRALTLAESGTPVEKALIRAASKRFAMPQPESRAGLDLAYANAMREVYREYPKDADVGALFAESMMDLRPWDLWLPNGKPQPGTLEIVATLERVIQFSPNHPLANHLYVHAVEASPNPGRGKQAANRLRLLQPGLGHMVHMPSHIDLRIGQWNEAITANRRAILTDDAYRASNPNQGFYRVYMAHNRHMLAFACMMTGRSKEAITAIDEMVGAFPAEFLQTVAPLVDGFMSMPIEVRKRFGMWDEVLAMPDLPEYFPLSRTMRHAARAVAFAAKGQPKDARNEQALFYEARKKVSKDATFGNNLAQAILTTDMHLMNGEILLAEGSLESAVTNLRAAVNAEDQLRYDEPPDWIQPTRHTLGALLLSMGRNKEAEAVYREDLKRLPENGWSLYGLSKALQATGRTSEAKRVAQRFNKVWANADVKIDSSCLCIPGK